MLVRVNAEGTTPAGAPPAASRLETALALGLATALLVHVTVRDAWPVVAILHYATPLPVLAAGALALAALGARRHARRRAVLAGTLAAALVTVSVLTLRGPGPDSSVEGPSLVLATWNAGRPSDLDEVRECWQRLQPDLLLVTEPGPTSDAAWAETFPGLTARRLPGGFAIVARGDVEVADARRLAPGHRSCRLRATLDGVVLDVVAVDLHGLPWRRRDVPLEELGRRLDALRSRHLVVLGDFNTPLDSAPLDGLRRGRLVEALAGAGRGWRATWPRPVPVLDIDHLLVGPELAVIEAEAGGCGGSDHRPVRARVRRPPP